MMAKHKCSINDSIKSEFPFIKGVNENVECTLCNAKFCITHSGRADVVDYMKTKNHYLRCFITTTFQLCFRICHQEDPRKPGGTEIEWDTSAAGVC
jgi:hypothetical protein